MTNTLDQTDHQVQVVGLGMAALDILLCTQELPTWDRGVRMNAVATDLYVTAGKRLIEAARADDASYFGLSQAAIQSFQERCGYYLDLFGASGKA